jgi:ParB family transcriptional regulator, chromosome partitioning protein
MAEERSRLGRGLAALIGDVGTETPTHERARSQRRVPIEHLKPNPRNPRRTFADDELEELAASVRERGIIQPIVVRQVRAGEGFEIIAGERRWRAAQRAGLHDVPVVVLDVGDGEALELAIIENVQRADLNPLDEASGYHQLITEYKHSQDAVAKIVGKSRSHVANTLRLLRLPQQVKDLLVDGKLSAGHARALMDLPDAEALAQEAVEKNLSVRALEAIAQERAQAKGQRAQARPRKPRRTKDADTEALEKRVTDQLGLLVGIDHHGAGGVVRIRYRTLDQLDEVVRRLERGR